MSTLPKISDELPSSALEQEAAAQRERIKETVSELKSQVRSTVREKLDAQRLAREYVKPVTGIALLLSLVVGYGFAGTVKHMFR